MLIWFSPDCISATCDTLRSWAAELVAISYTGWSTNPRKLKGQFSQKITAVPLPDCSVLSFLKPPPLTHTWHPWEWSNRKCFHLTFWWTVYGAAGCSLKQADLFWFIHSNGGDNFRAQMTGNNFLSSSSGNRTGQSTNYWGTGAMSCCPCCIFSASLPVKGIQNRTFTKRVVFAESNQTTVWLCVQKLPV